MSSSFIATIISGLVFGAALTASGVYSPWIIISQMQLSNFHMLQTFLAASGTSTIVMVLARRSGVAQCKPRSQSSLNLFPYDGNTIGGLLLGAGMALTGACPGTVLVQVATGIRSGYFALAGGILGGTLYARFRRHLRRGSVNHEPVTVYQSLGIKESNLVLVYEVVLLASILAASFTPGASNVLFHPFIGGLMIGAAQAVSLVLTGNAVGVSTGYEQVGNVLKWFWRRISEGNEQPGAFPASTSIAFAVGIFSGSSMLSRLLRLDVPGGEAPIGALTAMLGGLIMALGARIAGGCTSGHGISGMSTFSVSSIVSVVAMFSGGIGLAWIL